MGVCLTVALATTWLKPCGAYSEESEEEYSLLYDVLHGIDIKFDPSKTEAVVLYYDDEDGAEVSKCATLESDDDGDVDEDNWYAAIEADSDSKLHGFVSVFAGPRGRYFKHLFENTPPGCAASRGDARSPCYIVFPLDFSCDDFRPNRETMLASAAAPGTQVVKWYSIPAAVHHVEQDDVSADALAKALVVLTDVSGDKIACSPLRQDMEEEDSLIADGFEPYGDHAEGRDVHGSVMVHSPGVSEAHPAKISWALIDVDPSCGEEAEGDACGIYFFEGSSCQELNLDGDYTEVTRYLSQWMSFAEFEDHGTNNGRHFIPVLLCCLLVLAVGVAFLTLRTRAQPQHLAPGQELLEMRGSVREVHGALSPRLQDNLGVTAVSSEAVVGTTLV